MHSAEGSLALFELQNVRDSRRHYVTAGPVEEMQVVPPYLHRGDQVSVRETPRSFERKKNHSSKGNTGARIEKKGLEGDVKPYRVRVR